MVFLWTVDRLTNVRGGVVGGQCNLILYINNYHIHTHSDDELKGQLLLIS